MFLGDQESYVFLGHNMVSFTEKKDKDMDEKVSTTIASSGNQNKTSHTPLG